MFIPAHHPLGHPGSVREERVVSDLHLLECAMGASLVLDQRDVLPRTHAVDLGACRCSLLDLLLQVLQNLVPLTTQFCTVRCVLYIIIRNIRSILIGNSGAFRSHVADSIRTYPYKCIHADSNHSPLGLARTSKRCGAGRERDYPR